ncbi:galactose-specific lectin nattectin-like [Colossoma macropomum]|uniref:galactose-specific lectin nattectin-like n=1 Tax=Colossoma macropomum TaxID=42526 RepID=UPI0018654231|nr:galactose-specific lectin nattectin-like [Colossoma macropomum]
MTHEKLGNMADPPQEKLGDHQSTKCQNGWSQFGSRCFSVFTTSANWSASEEGVWMWTDGSAFDYINWSTGQPDNAGSAENCMEMNFPVNWNDIGCNTTLSSVCAKTINTTTVPSTTVPSTAAASTTVLSTTVPSTTVPLTTAPSTTFPQ